ncbi:MvaI/BcnI restriction endonuclease family [Shewanella psychrophila]|uniref:MvaI/BcnI restriction endonuclease family n=1 Tax=Shewanella psychrophila TaxID=225848 RepID=A0A1S6HI92_9GAMM|nr:MvaI/BcnI restriction endonuclease family [Shewanella psychrophila]
MTSEQSHSKNPFINIERLKQKAKKLKKSQNITQSEALLLVAQQVNFGNWKAVLKAFDKQQVLSRPDPFASKKVEDGELNQLDVGSYHTDSKELLVSKNKSLLTKLGIEFSIFEPTTTGLKKSILDATQPVRTHFELTNFHDYENQGQGQKSKVKKSAFFISDKGCNASKVSLYRPETKKGDPRMWFTKLGDFADSGDQIAIVVSEDSAYLINLSTNALELEASKPNLIQEISPSYGIKTTDLQSFINKYLAASNSISYELLAKLKVLAKKPLRAIMEGNTAIGMSIEAALDIEANSSKLPDYKGIELKSGRGNKTRTTLFAQVADWGLSTCKSSAAILDQYGYARENDFRLYCTLSTNRANSQGLKFEFNREKDELNEIHSSGDHVATWPGNLLRQRLKEKHAETF